ncbi:MAG: mechanosensitive ion channel domain-containing protein [Campylobacterales bacterium]
MRSIFLIFFLFGFATITLSADENRSIGDINTSLQTELLLQENRLKNAISELDNNFPNNNIWVKKYNNFLTYKRIQKEIADIEDRIKKTSSKSTIEERENLALRLETLKRQLEALDEYKENPFSALTTLKTISEIPKVDNPFAIFNAFTFIKQLQEQKSDYAMHQSQLKDLIATLQEKVELEKKLVDIAPTERNKKELEATKKMLKEFEYGANIIQNTLSIYQKRADEVIASLGQDIKEQVTKSLYIIGILVALFLISLLIKLANKKYINDNERLYTANKIVNFINVTLIVLILLFSYLENVTYLVTLVGFASAGLAIAMKDLFMSILGWLVIVFGGSIHVGDRVKVMKDGTVYVGDVLDISLLRITIHEDITLTTYMENRRAGRIIFIPNNYIFTTLISNYSHSGMKTVWDGIDVTISFDSNHKKAMQISKDIAKKYSKGYTDITRKQLNKLRDKYSLKNTNVEPRIFSFLEENGIKISVWYLTNSFATLILRSTISGEIITEFLKHEDIKIAYPTTTINIKKGDIAMEHKNMKDNLEKGLF